jgi:hypothetical protein
LPPEQLKALNEHIFKGNPATVEKMVEVFEKYPEVERQAVYWIGKNAPDRKQKMEAERVAEANLVSAEYAKRGYTLGVWALAIAILSTILSLVAIFK